jgi:hypothetical protein
MTIFQIFGSVSSIDRDALVLVEQLSTLEASKDLSVEIAPTIQAHFTDPKPLNLNFGVVRDGVITDTLKGIADETNNAVFTTYSLHPQPHPLAISRLLPRNFHAKYQRVARILLSLHSRTSERQAIKQALRGDLAAKLEAIERLDFSIPVEFGKNGTTEDVYKSIAFQLAQVLALAEGVELYTKEALIDRFPEFSAALRREPLAPSCQQALEAAKQRFCQLPHDREDLVLNVSSG